MESASACYRHPTVQYSTDEQHKRPSRECWSVELVKHDQSLLDLSCPLADKLFETCRAYYLHCPFAILIRIGSPVVHSHLPEMLGNTRPTVSTAAALLKRKRVIAYSRLPRPITLLEGMPDKSVVSYSKS